MRPALVLLAAGASRRLGRCKALADLGDGTPLGLLVAAARAAGLGGADDPPLCVTGRHHAEIAAAVAAGGPPGLELARNPAWEAGRTGGVALARDARPGRDLLLAPVDVPRVPARVFAALAEAWEAAGAPAQGWLAPRFESGLEAGGRHGHPVLVGRELLAELDSLAPGAPLRELRARARPLLDLSVDAPQVLDDLDRPEDLERLRHTPGG